jgi:hypothetical protein
MRKSIVEELYGHLRQMLYPRDFRIHSGGPDSADAEIHRVIQSLSERISNISEKDLNQTGDAQTNLQEDDSFVADLATRLWRIRQSLEKVGAEGSISGVERGYRHLERLFSFLEQIGIRVVDKTGEFYDAGMAIKVVSSEPIVGIRREIIKETVLPAVYRDDRLIQNAQVVVGLPASEGQ